MRPGAGACGLSMVSPSTFDSSTGYRVDTMPLRNIVSRVALFCLLGATAAATAASGDDQQSGRRPGPARLSEPFPLDLAFSRRPPFTGYEKVAVSPTGGHVAYVVVTPQRKRDERWTLPSGLPVSFLGARLHLAEVDTGKSVPLGAEGSTSFSRRGPRMAPSSPTTPTRGIRSAPGSTTLPGEGPRSRPT
jgi:hypothetical protein